MSKNAGRDAPGQAVGVYPPPAAGVVLAMDKLERAKLRARQAMDSWLPVTLVAKDWDVSARRVRTLLDEGRLHGRRLENGYWEVLFPYNIRLGTRGPASRREVKKSERMKERNS
ncbi:MAG: hypothetical protein ACLQHK_10125 [Gallionellaceae bacterium]